MSHLSQIEISRSALIHNIQAFRQLFGENMLITSVVKGNAYGHGMTEIVSVLDQYVNYFQVDDLLELERIREHTKKPVLVLGYVVREQVKRAIELEGEIAVYDTLRLPDINYAAQTLGKKAKVHIKIDTFLGRQGLLLESLQSFCQELHQYPHIEVTGVYSHFANIEDTSDSSHAQKQIATLHAAIAIIKENGFSRFKNHIASTAGALVYELTNRTNDLVRIGIGTYGLYPSQAIQEQFSQLNLRPVLRWVSHVAQIKELPENFPIGYGLTYITDKKTRIAIVPQGYSDGYSRAFSNKGFVLIHGTRCRVLGRISMNMMTVDVSHLSLINPEDEVVLLGSQGQEKITAEELGDLTGTINYEIVTNISPLLPRVITD